MVFANAKAGDPSGAIPLNRGQTVEGRIGNSNGHDIPGKDNSQGSKKFDFILINGVHYPHDIGDMTAADFRMYLMYGDAMGYSDPDSFADAAYGSYFADNHDRDQPPGEEICEQLRVLWSVAHVPFWVLLDDMGLDWEQCSERFSIDCGEIQGWCAGDTHIPPHVRLMMAESIGLLKLRNFI